MDDLFSGAGATDLPFRLPGGDGYAARWNEALRGFDVEVPDGAFFYAEAFFGRAVSDRAIDYFQENDSIDWRSARSRDVDAETLERIRFANIAWKQDRISMYGKQIPLPRLTSWYGDAGRSYTYSGITSHPNPWNKGLLHLKEKIEACAGIRFNSVLLNWYRDGDDHLSWHADDEPELGRNPIIASASFGAARDFVIRRHDDPSVRIMLPLRHGSLLVMKGALQHFWQHAVPRRKAVEGSRFNLTFRRVLD
ncbi:alkylated DNA repair dioxygenase AlkB [Sphingomonas zeicaulis]|uniref:alpha-ketoglutarate-dependent dioxygenase AlkB family protein n=1 Tax=Sphingomonas zeicaulis TaxID=1632740 RepID=UPI003D197465